jgi:hypothetical protein
MDRQAILEVIRRTAQENGGIPLGEDRLTNLGITPTVWGKYWSRLSSAQREAGLAPNKPHLAYPNDEAMARLIGLIRDLKSFPTVRDRRVKRAQDPQFPTERVFRRLGPKQRLLERLLEYAQRHPGNDDIELLCKQQGKLEPVALSGRPSSPRFGTVYLLQGQGRRFKVGKTNAFGRRARELSIQLPFETRKVHVIETDDPDGIELYWHRRFASKRLNGEWFELDAGEVAAFKRWKRLR